jgi:TRAP transporter 4TM/12TM fusion protein
MADVNGENTESGVDYAKQLADAEGGLGWAGTGVHLYVNMAIAILWSLFQLSVASWLLMDTLFIRAVHLAFAIVLVYWNIPMLKYSPAKRPDLKQLLFFNRITVLDMILGVAAAVSALYIIWDFEGIASRYGAPITQDLIFGGILVVLLLEATRRVIGPALPLIASFFILYAFLGPYMPDVIAFKGTSLNRFMGQMTMSSEGIYGIPLDVSATIVFLFVLFGTMLEKAGAGHYFIKLAMCLLGGMRGGPAKAAILGSGLTGMVSGSSIANVVTTGTFTIPLMKKVGYPPTKAAAIEVAASTNGQLAPPIMGAAAFIIAEYVNVPYVEVIKAAAIPAFAAYAALLYISHLEARKLGLKGIPRKELPPFWATFVSGIHFIIPLAMLLYELIVMRHSPKLAAFNAILVLAVVMLLQHAVRARRRGEPMKPAFIRGVSELVVSLADGARNMAGVGMATACAGIIVGVVALGLGGLITEVVDTLAGGNLYLLLGLTAFISLILGMGLPTTANYIVMASLTAPIIVTVGGDYGFVVPLMAAHLFCFFFGILADDTPPVGLAAYAAAAIAEAPPIQTGIQGFLYDIRTAILPFMFIFNTDIILHGINSWALGILIFVGTCIGCFAFAAAAMNRFIARNKIYEIPLLLAATLVMFRPELIAEWVGLEYEQRYYAYIIGIAILGVTYLLQLPRARAADKAEAAAA